MSIKATRRQRRFQNDKKRRFGRTCREGGRSCKAGPTPAYGGRAPRAVDDIPWRW